MDAICQYIQEQYVPSMDKQTYHYRAFTDIIGIQKGACQPINAPTNKNNHTFPSIRAQVYFVCCPSRKQGIPLSNNFPMKCKEICRITLQEQGRHIHMQAGPTKNTSDPFRKCQFIFEVLILFPWPKEQQLANNSCGLVQA